ncbi:MULTISPECIES: hypothetical protein [unclassified Rhodococcus (in: high G+C Gram-positive bacteria)]|uniref:hypothetical protein n=1 Tax=unclassified Rhodococcus (in: high G+C Gram-positive bacteria) TaxID=192944 RepID=UPI00211B7043|nr:MULTISPECIES: hypothetical protein [unclassified Rhodococcus (in: high G+C Gram-positive bacteria)]
MTVPDTTVGTQRNRVPAPRRRGVPQAPLSRPERTGKGGGRSGAALRAYERRQQRASIHTSDSAHGSGAGARPSLNGSAIAARIPFVALIIGLLAIGLGLTLLLTTRSAGDSYDLSAAKAVNAELAQQRASLQRDVELAESAPELARKAAELGMVPAKNSARLIVAPDGGVQVVGTPAPADGAPVAPLDPVSPAAAGEGTVANPSTQSPQPQTPRSASQPNRTSGTIDTRAATPNSSNGAGNTALAEQLVPMSIPSLETPAVEAPEPTGEASGDGQ